MKQVPVQFDVIDYETGRNVFHNLFINFPGDMENEHDMDEYLLSMDKTGLMHTYNWKQINNWKFTTEHEDLVKYLASMAGNDEEFISTLAICYQTMKGSISHLPFEDQANIIVDAVDFGLKGVNQTIQTIREILKPTLKLIDNE